MWAHIILHWISKKPIYNVMTNFNGELHLYRSAYHKVSFVLLRRQPDKFLMAQISLSMYDNGSTYYNVLNTMEDISTTA